MIKKEEHKRNGISEICLLAPSENLAQKAKQVIRHRNEAIDVYVPVLNDVLNDAIKISKDLAEQGAKVIISRKGIMTAIKKEVDIPVVGISTTLSDYIEPIETAKKVEGIVAFFYYEEIPEDVKSICHMLNINANYYMFKTDEDCERIVKKAMKDGTVLGIGGVITEKYSKKFNLKHITIENSEESILNSIETAKQILHIQKEEMKKQNELNLQLERYKAVLNFTHDAIIAVDETGKIDVINPVAEEIAKVTTDFAIGKNISDIINNTEMFNVLNLKEKQLNQLMKINGTLVSTNRVPIVVGNTVKGVVATFQDVKTIQDNEKKIRRSLHKKGLVAKYNFSDIKGQSSAIKNTIEIAKSYAVSDSTILIQGETGTGKELFAQSIHNASQRSDGPFVAINCAALSKNLLESELFGYEEGAFTGALKGGKTGLFELAHKGTIFLDEIGEIPIETQAQLLRVLQEKEIRRIGAENITPIDVRVIAATNKDLKEEIAEKRFREDLFYRINVLNFTIPPLRFRKEDITILSSYFFEKNFGSNYLKYKDDFDKIMNKVQDYDWYGNIRELQSFAERICVLMKYKDDLYDSQKLLNELLGNNSNDIKYIKDKNEDKDLSQWEYENIVNALKNNKLSVKKAADQLGISRTTLWRKMKQYEISL